MGPKCSTHVGVRNTDTVLPWKLEGKGLLETAMHTQDNNIEIYHKEIEYRVVE
jgi:hypothetical protein